MDSPLYKNLEVKQCNYLGILFFEVCHGYITLAAFAYESDAIRFKELVEVKEENG